MPEQPPTSSVPAPTADQRRIAVDTFTKAKEIIADGGFDYAIQLLLTCCRIDPANFYYRQTLRKTQKDKYANNLRGSRFAFLTTPRWKAKMKSRSATATIRKRLNTANRFSAAIRGIWARSWIWPIVSTHSGCPILRCSPSIKRGRSIPKTRL